jgi:hypothetical protein
VLFLCLTAERKIIMSEVNVNVSLEKNSLDEAVEKAESLLNKIEEIKKEAKSLSDEVASIKLGIEVKN